MHTHTHTHAANPNVGGFTRRFSLAAMRLWGLTYANNWSMRIDDDDNEDATRVCVWYLTITACRVRLPVMPFFCAAARPISTYTFIYCVPTVSLGYIQCFGVRGANTWTRIQSKNRSPVKCKILYTRVCREWGFWSLHLRVCIFMGLITAACHCQRYACHAFCPTHIYLRTHPMGVVYLISFYCRFIYPNYLLFFGARLSAIIHLIWTYFGCLIA